MSYLTTGLDLRLDALALAGEPTNGTSDYDGLLGGGETNVYELLTVTQRAIVAGGSFGPTVLQPEDWYWARAWPRGTIQLVQPYNVGQTVTATFTAGITTVTVASPTLPDLTGWRILRADTPARHIIELVDNKAAPHQIILRDPWTGDTTTDTQWLAYPDTYQLPADFIRGTSPLFLYAFPSNIPTVTTIDVIDPVDLDRQYPQTFPWGGNTSATVTGSGMPVLAARVTDTRIRFSHFLNTPQQPNPCQCEFEYLRRPPVIAEGTIPVIPIEHRRVLSYGAAYLILDDKKSTQMESMRADFMQTYKAMKDQHARDMRRMSSRWGVVQPPRASGNRAFRLTETGLPVYTW